MTKYEYRFQDWVNGESETLQKLDALGKEGWRVSAAFVWKGPPCFVLERPLP